MKQEVLTAEQFRSLAENRSSGPGSRRSKYHAVKCGGYDSKKECNRARQLKLMARAGLISDLREQVRYKLIPSQHCDDGTLERAVHYVADFVYTDNETGRTVVEDTKGVRTKEYIIKRKLMLYVHGIRIKEV